MSLKLKEAQQPCDLFAQLVFDGVFTAVCDQSRAGKAWKGRRCQWYFGLVPPQIIHLQMDFSNHFGNHHLWKPSYLPRRRNAEHHLSSAVALLQIVPLIRCLENFAKRNHQHSIISILVSGSFAHVTKVSHGKIREDTP